MTFAELADLYIERHARPRKSAASLAEDESRIRRHFIPRWGRRKADQVTKSDVQGLHSDIAMAGHPYAANRALAQLSKMFSLAVEWGVRTDNAAKGIKRFPEDVRDRWLRKNEVKALFTALTSESSPYIRGIFGLLLGTGYRKGEALHARWEDLDLENRVWRIPKTKSGKVQSVFLSDFVIAVLAGLPREEGSSWVFPGRNPDQPMYDLKRSWGRHSGTSRPCRNSPQFTPRSTTISSSTVSSTHEKPSGRAAPLHWPSGVELRRDPGVFLPVGDEFALDWHHRLS